MHRRPFAGGGRPLFRLSRLCGAHLSLLTKTISKPGSDDVADFGELGGEGAAGGAPVGGEVEAADGVGEVAVAGFLLGGGVLFAVGAALLEDYVLQDLDQGKLIQL